MYSAHGVCCQEHGHMGSWKIEGGHTGEHAGNTSHALPCSSHALFRARAAEGAREETWEESQPQGQSQDPLPPSRTHYLLPAT